MDVGRYITEANIIFTDQEQIYGGMVPAAVADQISDVHKPELVTWKNRMYTLISATTLKRKSPKLVVRTEGQDLLEKLKLKLIVDGYVAQAEHFLKYREGIFGPAYVMVGASKKTVGVEVNDVLQTSIKNWRNGLYRR